jgi:hemoglobin/transferrin/lactoferrin receptor protein
MKKRPVLCVAATLFFAADTDADTTNTNILPLHTVTVTARGYAAPQSETPGSIGVVTERDIAVAPKSSLADSLQNIPGITRAGDSPWGQDISIRGLSGGSVVVLLNGRRINTVTDMNARLGFVNPADVERIEVLKGPVSALYGSGSIGGVVNIITRQAGFTREAERHGRLAISGSTNPVGFDVYGSVSHSGPSAWAFASVAQRDYGDTYGGHNSRVHNSGFRDQQGRIMFGFRPWESLILTFEAMQSEGRNIGIPGGVSVMPQQARVTYSSTQFTYLGFDAALDVNSTYVKTVEASLHHTTNRRRVLVDNWHVAPPPPPPPAWPGAHPRELRPTADHTTWGGKLQSMIEAGSHTIVAGADFWTWSVSSHRERTVMRPNGEILAFSDTPIPDATQVSTGLFAENNWRFHQDWTVNMGARLDYLRTRADPMYVLTPNDLTPHPGNQQHGYTRESDIGRHAHAGLTFRMNPAWSQSLLLASSYRAANVIDRFRYINLGNNLTIYGNPGLKPEQSLNA